MEGPFVGITAGVFSWTSEAGTDRPVQAGAVTMTLEDLGDNPAADRFYWTQDGTLGKWSTAADFRQALGVTAGTNHNVQVYAAAFAVLDSTPTVVTWDAAVYDTDTYWDNGDPDVVTIPVGQDGIYIVTLSVLSAFNGPPATPGVNLSATIDFGDPQPLSPIRTVAPFPGSGDLTGAGLAFSGTRGLSAGQEITVTVAHVNSGEPTMDLAIVLSLTRVGDFVPA